MRTIAMPVSACNSRSRSRICACTVTSSAVVGSSAIKSRGRQASAMAIITRWRIPPESWCGYSSKRRSGEGMRTRRRAAMAAARIALSEAVRSWARMASTIWAPALCTGLSEVMGSWKIIATCDPRTSRMADKASGRRSRPSSSTRPAATRPGGGTSRITESESTDLPQPLSPTTPSVRPRGTERLTPSTAGTSPAEERKTVRSPSIRRRSPVTTTGRSAG